jgi:hypothetical protein
MGQADADRASEKRKARVASAEAPASVDAGVKLGGRVPTTGYRYQCGANRAVWLPGRRVVVFFREGGQLLGIVDVAEENAEQAA